ncbi:hypothetical protein RFI_31366 [Reticulomyxa filosa]|uniref:C3H1-type domain-containing protein n=1 Tax=Reticulomyxa filosa TaxID=46433 RepID=X6LXE3_RETFI|nr:hypothetical protein RFI_31366 [Reticulomyxa filosa]|eukprot:ETO06031.1 hypothetical protein RFI_31366 [Reticulomyxa filosa]
MKLQAISIRKDFGRFCRSIQEKSAQKIDNHSTNGVKFSITTCGIDENQQRSRISPKNAKPHLYKTELCSKFQQFGWCPYNQGCQFAHGKHELRKKPSLYNKRKKNTNNEITLQTFFFSSFRNTLDNSKQPNTTPQVSAVLPSCAIFPYFANNNLPTVYNQSTFNPLSQHVMYQSSVLAPKIPFANEHAAAFVNVQSINPLTQSNIIPLDERQSKLVHPNETVGNTLTTCALSEFSSLRNTLLSMSSNFSTSPAKSDISLNRLTEGLVIPLKNENNVLQQETIPQNPIDKELEKINESIQQLEKKRESLLHQMNNKTDIVGSSLFLREVTKSNKENFFPIGGY